MNNGYNPQQQQPPQRSPQYQKASSLIDKIYGKRTDLLQTLLTFTSLCLILLAPLAIIYNFFVGVIGASDTWGTFNIFFSYIASGVYKAAIYITLGLVLAALKRLISK